MKSVVVIGHLDWKNNTMSGAVAKARNIHKELTNQLGQDSVGDVDIFGWKQSPIKTMFNLLKAFKQSPNIVIVASKTAPALMHFFRFLKKIFKNQILYAVVGGDIADNLSKNPQRIKHLKIIDAFLVETHDCVENLKKLGIENAILFKNFKLIQPISESEIPKNFHVPFKFCIFSRIIEQKGVTDAINAIEEINSEKKFEYCILDIYGPIDDSYRDAFQKLLAESKSCFYRGVINESDSVDILKKYYCLLFPTKYQSEGIPGTIIDAFASGLPVICSDWIRRSYIIDNNYNGIVYPFGDFDALKRSVMFSMEHQDILCEMRYSALKSFDEYKSSNAILPLLTLIRKDE